MSGKNKNILILVTITVAMLASEIAGAQSLQLKAPNSNSPVATGQRRPSIEINIDAVYRAKELAERRDMNAKAEARQEAARQMLEEIKRDDEMLDQQISESASDISDNIQSEDLDEVRQEDEVMAMEGRVAPPVDMLPLSMRKSAGNKKKETKPIDEYEKGNLLMENKAQINIVESSEESMPSELPANEDSITEAVNFQEESLQSEKELEEKRKAEALERVKKLKADISARQKKASVAAKALKEPAEEIISDIDVVEDAIESLEAGQEPEPEPADEVVKQEEERPSQKEPEIYSLKQTATVPITIVDPREGTEVEKEIEPIMEAHESEYSYSSEEEKDKPKKKTSTLVGLVGSMFSDEEIKSENKKKAAVVQEDKVIQEKKAAPVESYEYEMKQDEFVEDFSSEQGNLEEEEIDLAEVVKEKVSASKEGKDVPISMKNKVAAQVPASMEAKKAEKIKKDTTEIVVSIDEAVKSGADEMIIEISKDKLGEAVEKSQKMEQEMEVEEAPMVIDITNNKPVKSNDTLSIASMFEPKPDMGAALPLSMQKSKAEDKPVEIESMEINAPVTSAAIEAEDNGDLLPPQSIVPLAINNNEPVAAIAPKQQQKIEVASLPDNKNVDAVVDSGVDGGSLISIEFLADETDMPTESQGKLEQIISGMQQDNSKRLSIIGYASNPDDTISTARRVSLKRALSVRKSLIDSGIESTRINVQAMGNQYEGQGNKDRVDLFFIGESGLN